MGYASIGANCPQGRIQGGPGPPIFCKVNFIFYIVYNIWKNIFEIKFVFYSGRNPRSFWKYGGVCVCVCESKSWRLLFFVLQRPNFEWYPRPFWPQKYMPDCRKSHIIFQKFLRRPPAFGARFGASPPYRAPLSKIPGSAPGPILQISVSDRLTVFSSSKASSSARSSRAICWVLTSSRALAARCTHSYIAVDTQLCSQKRDPLNNL